MNMRKSILALAALVPLCFGMTSIAEAKPKIVIHLGVPYYSYSLGPDYRFQPGRGWYRDRNWGNRRISCDRARNILRNNGYRNIAVRECDGPTYTFRATRNGNRVVLYVNARNGRFWRS
jgi:hypothetical protein